MRTTIAASTTTAPAVFPYWTDDCAERTGDPGASYESSEALGAFTTLGAAPTLDLVMPGVVTSAGPYGSIARSSPIPGGVLVGVYPPDGWPVPDEVLYSSSVTVVDHDGSIRWRRCFDEFQTVGFRVAPAELSSPRRRGSSVRHGTSRCRSVVSTSSPGPTCPSRSTSRRSASADRASGSSCSGSPIGVDPVEAGDQLTVVDTLEGTTWAVPVPPSWVGGDGGWVQVIDVNPFDGEFVLADDVPMAGETAAVYVDGAWTEDPAVLREALPPQVTETFGEPFELRLFDGAGDLVWAVPEFHSVSREGFHWLVADSVVLAMRCTTWDDDACNWVNDQGPEEELVAFDIETGQEPLDGGGCGTQPDRRRRHGHRLRVLRRGRRRLRPRRPPDR